MKKRILSFLLCALLMMSCIVPAVSAETDDVAAIGDSTAEATYTVKRISNPDRREREVDGLIEGGDRENSYTWRLAMRGDEIYIATTRNIASALVNMYAPAFSEAGISVDAFWALINVVTNGDIPRNDANEGANILSYNRKTGEFKVIYTAGTGDYFRMAVTFGDNVYFGSYSAVPTNPQYILKLDTEGNFTKVFQTMGSVSLRANCVYDDHLFFAGADDRTPIAEGEPAPVAKMAVLMKSNEDDTVWDRVADFRDFGLTSYDPIHESWAGAPIWELASHDGYIYATAPTHNGFVIYKGHPAADGETANAYGWYWEEVAGTTNGVNNPGLSDVEGGEPGTMRSLIGSVYEFNGELYAYNFDHSFGGEASAFAGILQQVAGKDVKASEYLFYLYNSLQNPQKVWKLNDETGKFEELTAFTELMEGTTNEYVWRLGQYDGDLYVATMDAGIFYNYLTQLTNGSFFKMTEEEKQQKIGYITDMIKLLAAAKTAEAASPIKEKIAELQAQLEQVKEMLINILFEEVINEETTKTILEYTAMLSEVKKFAEQLAKDILSGNADYSFSVEDGKDEDDDLAPTGAFDINTNLETILNLLPEEEREQLEAEIMELITSFDFEAAKAELIEALKNALVDAVHGIVAAADELYQKIDGDGIKMYLEINNTVANSEWGFDLLRTSDGGESFEVITRSGFDDKYNYGCPCFLETEEGLYLGTCNPFYGGQLYLLTNTDGEDPGEDPGDDPEPGDKATYLVGDADGDGEVIILDATLIQRWLTAMASDDEIDQIAADADGDGQVTVLDATAIQRWLAGMPTAEGIGEPQEAPEEPEEPEEPGRPAEDVLTMTTMGEVYAAYPNASAVFDNGAVAMIIKGEEHVYRVSAKLPESIYDAIIEVPISEPDADAKIAALLKDIPVENCEDIISQKLSDDEIAALVGKTGQQLLDMGFVDTGYGLSEEGTLVMEFGKGPFAYEITFSGTVQDSENFDAIEACKPLTVASAEYIGLS